MLVWLVVSVAWGGAAPELPEVLARTAPLRAMRLAEGAPAISPAEVAQVAAGEIVVGLFAVEGEAAKKSYGFAVLDQPISRMWAAISDESRHPAFTSLDYAELVKGEPCASGRRVLQYLPVGFPGVKDRWWVTIRTNNDALHAASAGAVRELVYRNAPDGADVTSEAGKAKMAEGVMVGFTRGAWHLTAVNERQTLVEYLSWVDPGGALSPSLMTWFAGRTIRSTMSDMERLAAQPDLKCVW